MGRPSRPKPTWNVAGHRPGRSLAGRRPQYRVKVARVAPRTPAADEASAVVDVAPTAAPPGVPGPAGQAPVAGAAAEVPVQALAATAVTADTGAARDMLEQALARASEGEARQGHEGREEPPAASTSVQTGFEFMGIRFQGSIKGMLLLNLGAALFGCNQVVIKEAEELLSPGSLSALRFAIAAACFLPAITRGLRDSALRASALELGLYLFLGYTLQAEGLALTSAARSAVTGTFTVLTVPFLVGMTGRRIPVATWVAALTAVAGVALLVGDQGDPNWGDALCIGSAVMFGIHKFRTESVTTRFADQTSELMAVQLAVLAGGAALYAAPELAALWGSGGPGALAEAAAGVPWVAVAWMGLATTALTLYIEVESLKEVSAPLAALIYTSEPLWGAVLAWFLLDERWGATGWAGAALIIGSSLYSQLGGDKVGKASKASAKAQ